MLWSIIFGIVVSLSICLLASPIGIAMNVMDIPDGNRKLHLKPTPMVGGIAATLPVFLVMCFLALSTPFTPFYITIGAALFAFLLLGLIDDRNHLRPFLRLTFSSILALAVLFAVPSQQVTFFRFSFLDPVLFLGGLWSLVFTVLCLVGLQNALNMADGRNGLAIGLLLIWTFLLFGYSPPHLYPILGTLSAALAVTFIFNIKGKLFLGDSGTYGLSITIGLLTIHTYGLEFPSLYADAIALWFFIPIVDALRLMLFRMMDGRSPFSPDADHFHHILERRFSHQWGLFLYLILVLLPAGIGWLFPDFILPVGAVVFSVYCFIVFSAHWDPIVRRLRLRLPSKDIAP